MAEMGSGQRKSLGAILLDCGIAGLLTFVIAAPIMGLRTVNSPGGMTLDQNWGKVLTAVLVVFFGRLVLQLFVWNRADGSGFGRLVLRLVLAALIGFAVGTAVCLITLGPDSVTLGAAMSNALTAVPWNIATLLFAVAAFSLSYGMFPRQAASVEPSAGAGTLEALGDLFKLALLVIAIALPFLPWSDRYILDLAILILTYVMLGWGLNVVVGLAGLLDLGYVAFYAVGAYSYALLATVYFPLWFPTWLMPFAFWIALPLAGMLAALWGIMLGFPVLRLRGDYLAIVTLAFGEIIRVVLINWSDFTGGPNGISGIPRPTFFGIPLNSSDQGLAAWLGIPYAPIQRIIFLYYIILGLALVTNLVTLRLRSLPLGRAWEALREDEIACRSLGINTTNTKLTAFAIGAMFGGIAGSFFATRQGFISPEILRLHGVGADSGDRRAGRPRLADRRGDLGHRDDRRLRGLPQSRLPALGVRPRFRPGAISHDRVRPRHGVDHDLAAARPGDAARAVDLSQGAQGGVGRAGCRGARVMADPLLAVEHLTMRFGGLTAVSDLSFAAQSGEITAIIGPNGAGKTTLFNCITGFYKPTEGRITLAHEDGARFLLERMDDFRISQLAKVARTFQNIRLFAGMTVLENLIVAQHNTLMRASGFTIAGILGLPAYRRAERQATKRRCSGSSASGWSIGPTIPPPTCPMAPSAGSRSPGPCAPIPSSCASTSRRPASIRASRTSSTGCCWRSATTSASASC